MLKNRVGNEQGGVLFIAAFATLIILVCGLTTYYMATTELTASSARYEKAKAHYLAEAGVQRAISELTSGMNDGWDDELIGADGELGTCDDGILSFGAQVDCYVDDTDSQILNDTYSQTQEVPMNQTPCDYLVGHYSVRLSDGRPEDERNEPCNRVIVRSVGTSGNNVKKVIESEFETFSLIRSPSTAFIIPGADTTAYPDADYSGQSWVIDGSDTNPGLDPNDPSDDVPVYNSAVFGIGVNANPQSFIDNLRDNQRDQIRGAGFDSSSVPPTPSIGQLDVKLNLDETASNMMKIADQTVAPGTYSTFTGFGSPSDYQVTVCDGDLHLSGQIQGYGVLVVTGDFKMSGSGTWNGYIIVLGDVEFAGGGDQFLLYGSVMCGTSSGLGCSTKFSIKGNADLYYSSSEIEKAREGAKGVVQKSWRSKPAKEL